MASRCPTSRYHSFGLLRNHIWVIGPRGYANIVPSSDNADVVYGMLYTLTSADESALDIAEGVPECYIKQILPVELLAPNSGTVDALVYIDVARPGVGTCREEYVARMNRGIQDAVGKGMPMEYVETVMRKWVREAEVPEDLDIDDPFHPMTTSTRST